MYRNEPNHYILDGKTPIPCPRFIQWSSWFQWSEEDRKVAETTVEGKIVRRVSTIFLGFDEDDNTPPKLFETKVFDEPSYNGPHDRGKYGGYKTAAATWKEAKQQHAAAVKYVEKHGENPPD